MVSDSTEEELATADGGESDAEEGDVDDFEAGLEVFNGAELEGGESQIPAGDVCQHTGRNCFGILGNDHC